MKVERRERSTARSKQNESSRQFQPFWISRGLALTSLEVHGLAVVVAQPVSEELFRLNWRGVAAPLYLSREREKGERTCPKPCEQ